MLGLLGGSAAGYGAKLGYQGIVRGGQALDRVLPALKSIAKKGIPVWGEGVLDYGADKQTEKEVEKVVKEVQKRREPAPLSRLETGRVRQSVESGLTGASWYSRAEDTVLNAKQRRATVDQWVKEILRSGGEGELNMTGGLDALRKAEGVLNQQEVLTLLQPYIIQLEEKYYTNDEREAEVFEKPRWTRHTNLHLDDYGIDNQVEILLKLPQRHGGLPEPSNFIDHDWNRDGPKDNYNVLVHIRGNDGKLFNKNAFIIQEIQSNWHQKGQASGYWHPPTQEELKAWYGGTIRGQQMSWEELSDWDRDNLTNNYVDFYREDMVPDAPYKTTWHELGFKRALMEALRDPNKEYLAWTTGEVQAERNYGENWEVDWPEKSKFPLQLYNEKMVRFAKKFLGVTPQRHKPGEWTVFDARNGNPMKYFDSDDEAKKYIEYQLHRIVPGDDPSGSNQFLDYDKTKGDLWYIKINEEVRDKFIKTLEGELPGGKRNYNIPLHLRNKEEVQMFTDRVEGGGLLGSYA
tara:strand:- start:56 stop:1609 length:1554 start_codon:yes stop_codon:yes gene_type:complete